MKTDLITILQTFLKHEKLENQKLLLMVSGGVDSVVLLHVATQAVAPDSLAVFHLNHNARDNAEDDLSFVQNLCSKLSVKFYAETLHPGMNEETPKASRDRNIESKWRKQRQALAQATAQDFGAAKILTAHHATDLVETMIFRLTKGAGPGGLSPFDTSTKPFWQTPKQILVDYAQAHNLSWQEDESNLNIKFERNLIRAEVLPPLRKITPNLEAVFVREAKTFAEVSDFLNSELQNQGALFLKNQSIPLESFLNLHAVMQTEFLRAIATTATSQSEIEDALKWLHGSPAGNSRKSIGGTKLAIKQKQLIWAL